MVQIYVLAQLDLQFALLETTLSRKLIVSGNGSDIFTGIRELTAHRMIGDYRKLKIKN